MRSAAMIGADPTTSRVDGLPMVTELTPVTDTIPDQLDRIERLLHLVLERLPVPTEPIITITGSPGAVDVEQVIAAITARVGRRV